MWAAAMGATRWSFTTAAAPASCTASIRPRRPLLRRVKGPAAAPSSSAWAAPMICPMERTVSTSPIFAEFCTISSGPSTPSASASVAETDCRRRAEWLQPHFEVVGARLRYHPPHTARSPIRHTGCGNGSRILGAKITAGHFAGLVPMFVPDPLARLAKAIEPLVEATPLLRCCRLRRLRVRRHAARGQGGREGRSMTRGAITGAAGFIGANLARRLLRNGQEVHALTGSRRPMAAAKSLTIFTGILPTFATPQATAPPVVRHVKPQRVFHLAAHGAIPGKTTLRQILETNFLGTVNLLEACTAVGVERFINTGSSSEYGFKETVRTGRGRVAGTELALRRLEGLGHLVLPPRRSITEVSRGHFAAVFGLRSL